MRPLMHYAVWQVTLAMLIAVAGLRYITSSLNLMFASFSNLFGQNFRIIQLAPQQLIMLWVILVIFTIFTVFLAVRWVFNHSYNQ